MSRIVTIKKLERYHNKIKMLFLTSSSLKTINGISIVKNNNDNNINIEPTPLPDTLEYNTNKVHNLENISNPSSKYPSVKAVLDYIANVLSDKVRKSELAKINGQPLYEGGNIVITQNGSVSLKNIDGVDLTGTGNIPLKTINGHRIIGSEPIIIEGLTTEQKSLINQINNKVNKSDLEDFINIQKNIVEINRDYPIIDVKPYTKYIINYKNHTFEGLTKLTLNLPNENIENGSDFEVIFTSGNPATNIEITGVYNKFLTGISSSSVVLLTGKYYKDIGWEINIKAKSSANMTTVEKTKQENIDDYIETGISSTNEDIIGDPKPIPSDYVRVQALINRNKDKHFVSDVRIGNIGKIDVVCSFNEYGALLYSRTESNKFYDKVEYNALWVNTTGVAIMFNAPKSINLGETNTMSADIINKYAVINESTVNFIDYGDGTDIIVPESCKNNKLGIFCSLDISYDGYNLFNGATTTNAVLYSLKIYNKQNQLIADYIPVKKIGTREGYLFNTITGNILNAYTNCINEQTYNRDKTYMDIIDYE